MVSPKESGTDAAVLSNNHDENIGVFSDRTNHLLSDREKPISIQMTDLALSPNMTGRGGVKLPPIVKDTAGIGTARLPEIKKVHVGVGLVDEEAGPTEIYKE